MITRYLDWIDYEASKSAYHNRLERMERFAPIGDSPNGPAADDNPR